MKHTSTDETFQRLNESSSGAVYLAEKQKLNSFEAQLKAATHERDEIWARRTSVPDSISHEARALVKGGSVATAATALQGDKLADAERRVRVLEQAIHIQRDEVKAALNRRNAANAEALRIAYSARVKRLAAALAEFSAALAEEENFRYSAIAEDAMVCRAMWYPSGEDHRLDVSYSTARGWFSEATEHYGVRP